MTDVAPAHGEDRVTPGVPAKMIASVMGLGAFTLAIISGLAVDNPADRILSRALICMFVCNILGMVLGLLAERTVADAIHHYTSTRPVNEHSPDTPAHPAPTAQGDVRRAAAA